VRSRSLVMSIIHELYGTDVNPAITFSSLPLWKGKGREIAGRGIKRPSLLEQRDRYGLLLRLFYFYFYSRINESFSSQQRVFHLGPSSSYEKLPISSPISARGAAPRAKAQFSRSLTCRALPRLPGVNAGQHRQTDGSEAIRSLGQNPGFPSLPNPSRARYTTPL
jgi:hypothetical protein